MSDIRINQSGVQARGGAIGALASATVQLAVSYVATSDTHQGGLDGGARFHARNLNNSAQQAADAACETTQNLRAFMIHASQTMVTSDQTQSTNIEQLGG